MRCVPRQSLIPENFNEEIIKKALAAPSAQTQLLVDCVMTKGLLACVPDSAWKAKHWLAACQSSRWKGVVVARLVKRLLTWDAEKLTLDKMSCK